MNKKELIAAVDAGTTGTRCCMIDRDGKTVASGYVPMTTIYPSPGRAEQDPKTVIERTFQAVSMAMESEKVDPACLSCLCITVQ